MSKFKVKLVIEKFSLEIEGSRDDVPQITQSLGDQFANMLQPTAQIVEGNSGMENDIPPTKLIESQASTPRKRATHSNNKKKNTESSGEDNIINWIHDPAKWGSPQQSWKTSDKAIWLLFVVDQEKGIKDLSGTSIAATFNHHFKQAKIIKAGNVNRDLGKLKIAQNSTVSEDTTKSPPKWFLTQEGLKHAETLVVSARGQ